MQPGKAVSFGFRISVLAVVVGVILVTGLDPRNFLFRNQVEWLEEEPGLRFGEYGIAFSESLITAEQAEGLALTGLSIEIGLEAVANPNRGFKFIALFHGGDNASQLLIGQWNNAIVAMNGDDYSNARRLPRIWVETSPVPGTKHFLTVTSGEKGTALYLDGQFSGNNENLRLVIPTGATGGRLVLGNSVSGRHPWKGILHGLAVYPRVLGDSQIKRHHEEWRAGGSFSFVAPGETILLYPLDEHQGRVANDHSDQKVNLEIPARFAVLQREMLARPFRGVEHRRDMVINLVGFIPLGLVVAALLRSSGSRWRRRSALVVLVLGFGLSLGIEITQSWMPSRSSSLLDLMLNSAGSFLGFLLFCVLALIRSRLVRGLETTAP